MKNFLNSKKGQATDGINSAIVVFEMALVIILFFTVWSGIHTAFSSSTIITDNAGTVEVLNSANNAYLALDYGIVIIIVLMLILAGVLAYRISTAPIFFLVGFFLWPFMGLVAYFFSALFSYIASQPYLSSIILYFPRTIVFATNLHWVGLAFFVVGSIALYSKKRSESDL